MLVRATLLATFAAAPAHTQTRRPALPKGPQCRFVGFEGEVNAGQAFRKQFTPGLEFFLEPLASGWIVRVLAVRNGHEIREPHDYAEVATPPYRSVSPLLITTDWAFRAQDAVAWNPRPFRFAADVAAFTRLSAGVDRILKGDRSAESDVAQLVMKQPEASLRLLDATIVPGTRDQARMASTVATHLDQTPLQVVQGVAPSPLGRLQHIRFRVKFSLPDGVPAAPGLNAQQELCMLKPTE